MRVTGPSLLNGVKLSPDLEKALKATNKPADSESFGKMLTDKLNQVDQAQKAADTQAENIATGKSKNLHEAILAMEMAETSLRMAVTVRNKVIDAYQEIMRMPV